MRSLHEIRFRVQQELRNLTLLADKGTQELDLGAAAGVLPNGSEIARQLANSTHSAEIISLADRIVRHEFLLFETEIDTGSAIDWRRDYKHGITSPASYFRFIPYLDIARAGDHKWIWELNRHQHLVVLAQAFLFTGERRYLTEIEDQIQSWLDQNPFQRGINWASALEVAFRAVSWAWVIHLAGPHLQSETLHAMVLGLYRHSQHLENNLSFYFSPNTHLLGEAVALHALGILFPQLPNAARIHQLGRKIVYEQLEHQVRSDGSYFEQSTYYHIYALDMLLFHASLEPVDRPYRETIVRMADFLFSLLGLDRKLPFLGDDDGGRWFFPFGDRAVFGRSTLAACNQFLGENRWACDPADYETQAYWFFGPNSIASAPPMARRTSRVFPDAGLICFESDEFSIVIDAGGFGRGSAGHSHADTLNLIVRSATGEWLIDPGTFTYAGSAKERNRFRSTAAHNTVCIDREDQANPAGAFRWLNPPKAQLVCCSNSPDDDIVVASVRYRGFVHSRWVHFVKASEMSALLVVDYIEGPGDDNGGEHLLEQFWHLGADNVANRFRFIENPQSQCFWRSRCFGQRDPAPVLRIARRCPLPAILPAAICLGPKVDIDISVEGNAVQFCLKSSSETRHIRVNWPADLR